MFIINMSTKGLSYWSRAALKPVYITADDQLFWNKIDSVDKAAEGDQTSVQFIKDFMSAILDKCFYSMAVIDLYCLKPQWNKYDPEGSNQYSVNRQCVIKLIKNMQLNLIKADAVYRICIIMLVAEIKDVMIYTAENEILKEALNQKTINAHKDQWKTKITERYELIKKVIQTKI